MPMPHRTFAQVAKRRLVGTEGRERIRVVRELLAELRGLLSEAEEQARARTSEATKEEEVDGRPARRVLGT